MRRAYLKLILNLALPWKFVHKLGPLKSPASWESLAICLTRKQAQHKKPARRQDTLHRPPAKERHGIRDDHHIGHGTLKPLVGFTRPPVTRELPSLLGGHIFPRPLHTSDEIVVARLPDPPVLLVLPPPELQTRVVLPHGLSVIGTLPTTCSTLIRLVIGMASAITIKLVFLSTGFCTEQ
jgi:hypothetical protein